MIMVVMHLAQSYKVCRHVTQTDETTTSNKYNKVKNPKLRKATGVVRVLLLKAVLTLTGSCSFPSNPS